MTLHTLQYSGWDDSFSVIIVATETSRVYIHFLRTKNGDSKEILKIVS